MFTVKTKNLLSFLTSFAHALGVTQSAFAKKADINPSTFTNWITNNDILVSKIYEMTAAWGYRCSLFIEPKETDKAEKYRFNCVHANANLEGDNLGFLKDFLEINGLNKAEVCYKIGLTRGRLNYYFKNHDITLSRVIDIANAYNCNVRIVIHPLLPEKTREISDDSLLLSELHIFDEHAIDNNRIWEGMKPRPGRCPKRKRIKR